MCLKETFHYKFRPVVNHRVGTIYGKESYSGHVLTKLTNWVKWAIEKC